MELATNELYKTREIKGFCHLAIGQEACNVGVEIGMTKNDHLVQTYRCHGNAYMRGLTIE